MRLQLIVCKVLQREAYYCAARSCNIVDVVVMEQGLHCRPEKLQSELAKALKRTSDSQGNPYDASLLGYGLCGKGTIGLSAKIPIVMPRAHDCITLLLGSKERYQDYFNSHPGTYWYSPGWIETGTQPGKERTENLYEIFREKYGPEKARALIEIEREWTKKYSLAAYIGWEISSNGKYRQYAKECADTLGWEYRELPAEPGLFQRLLDSQWHNSEFLVLTPGQKSSEDINNDGIIKAL